MIPEKMLPYLVFEEPDEKSFSFFELTTRERFGGQCLAIRIAARNIIEKDEWYIIDAGVVISDGADEEDLLPEHRRGLNSPQLEALKSIWHQVKSVLVSHAHDDHIAELPKLYSHIEELNFKVPIVTAPFSAFRIIKKFIDHNRFVDKCNEAKINHKLKKVQLPEIQQDIFRIFEEIKCVGTDGTEIVRQTDNGKVKSRVVISDSDRLKITAIQVPHSTPHTYVFDFKIKSLKKTYNFILNTDSSLQDSSFCPGLTWNYLSYLNEHSPIYLFAYDSLYADRVGHTDSEDKTRAAFRWCLNHSKGNLIVTHFATNCWRSRMVQEESKAADRWHWFCGRTMEEVSVAGRNQGWLLEEWQPSNPTNPAVISVTGNQAEEDAALTRASFKENKDLVLAPSDSIVHMAEIISGNEDKVVKMLIRLSLICKEGTIFVSFKTYEAIKKIYGIDGIPENIIPVADLHVSGHMSELDHQMITSVAKPMFVAPIHYPRTSEKIVAIKSFHEKNHLKSIVVY